MSEKPNQTYALKVYYCLKCEKNHKINTKIFKTHYSLRQKEYPLKVYFCVKCKRLHRKKTNIHIEHYKFKSKETELDSNELWLISFKNQWKRSKKQYKEYNKNA